MTKPAPPSLPPGWMEPVPPHPDALPPTPPVKSEPWVGKRKGEATRRK